MTGKTLNIDIHNDPSLFDLIINSIPYLPGWEIDNSVNSVYWKNYPHRTARFFTFSFITRNLVWAYLDEHENNVPNLISIRNAAQMSRILNRIYDYTVKYPVI